MMIFPRNAQSRAAFTFVELLVTSGAMSVVLAALLTGVVVLQKSFSAATDFSNAHVQQVRVLDYIERDARNAKEISVSANGQTISLYLPKDYNAAGTPVDPQIVGQQILYTDATARTRVSYYLQAGNFIRNVDGKTSVIAADVSDFAPNIALTSSGTTAMSLRSTLSFATSFKTGRPSSGTANTTTNLTNQTSLRNRPTLVAFTTPPVTGVASSTVRYSRK